MKKKASMQLSINMIIMLIIAVVVLGLALHFIIRLINPDIIKLPDEPEPIIATATNPLTMSRGDSIITRDSGEQIVIKWSVYSDVVDCDGAVIDLSGCEGLSVNSQADAKILFGESGTIMTVLDVSKSLPLGTYICTAKTTACSTGNLDIALTID